MCRLLRGRISRPSQWSFLNTSQKAAGKGVQSNGWEIECTMSVLQFYDGTGNGVQRPYRFMSVVRSKRKGKRDGWGCRHKSQEAANHKEGKRGIICCDWKFNTLKSRACGGLQVWNTINPTARRTAVWTCWSLSLKRGYQSPHRVLIRCTIGYGLCEGFFCSSQIPLPECRKESRYSGFFLFQKSLKKSLKNFL